MKAKYIEHPYESELLQLCRAACAFIKVDMDYIHSLLGWTLGKGRRNQVNAYFAETVEGRYCLLINFSINGPCYFRVCGPVTGEQKGFPLTSLALHERGMMLGNQEPWDTLPSYIDGKSLKFQEVPVPDLVKKPDLGAFKHYWNKVETQETLLQKDREQKAAKVEKLTQSRTRYKV